MSSSHAMTIIFNNPIQKDYDAVKIVKTDDSHYVISYAYETKDGILNPIYNRHVSVRSYEDVWDYMNILLDMLVVDVRPSPYIEIQANMFPNVMLSSKTLDVQKQLIQRIMRTLFVTMTPT